MKELDRFFVPYSVPCVIIKNKITGVKEIFYAVSSNGDIAIIGEIGEGNSQWINQCREISKYELISNFILCQ
ncbi:hypothetical protein [Paenibacillus sp. P32E]|uniref:hypothetical protein n=1 Tax=Paenibacillus sp. P32E TaxID=1349434 RepID=UPI00093F9309|nr:hypothetical protein [Paenibacillus sp. P32E]OKP85836.1 hypothetical protein A3848_22215 [Paenibacillus sp. P32E]